jgi:DNA/RNA non-specific endonuclease
MPKNRKYGHPPRLFQPMLILLNDQEAMDETFILSNIAPQVGNGFNRHCELWGS